LPLAALPCPPHPFPTRRSSDLAAPTVPTEATAATSSSASTDRPPHCCRCTTVRTCAPKAGGSARAICATAPTGRISSSPCPRARSEEHTSELQSRFDLVCRLLL